MKHKIITINDGDESKILNIPAQCISDSKEARTIIKDLVDSLPQGGIGLAAPQIGFNKRAFIVRDGNKILEFINPKLVISPRHLGETEIDAEGCLSIPGKSYLVSRYRKIEILDTSGIRFFDGQMARIVQHEIFHLGGVTVDKIGKEIII